MPEYIKHPTTGAHMRTPLIVGMDPGAEKGYALVDPEKMRSRRSWDAPHVVAMGCSLSELIERIPAGVLKFRPIWACVEFQYAQRVQTGEISADSIIKLGFRAGYMLAECLHLMGADETLATVPQRWKTELFIGGASERKDRFTSKLMRELMPDELRELQKIEEEDDKQVDDVVDAIGIAWAAWHVRGAPARFREWRCDPERIIPYAKSPTGAARKKRFQRALMPVGRPFVRKEAIPK